MKIQLKHLLKNFTGIQIFRNSLPRGVDLSNDIMRIHPYELQEIWDIGAHKGETTLKFAGDFPTALIRSFEPVSENYYKQCISLPIYPNLTQKEQNFVINKINEFYG